MTHPLVLQLRFARGEFVRGLKDVTDEEARKRFMPMNCISWMVGHLAYQENTYWLYRAQGENAAPELIPLVGWGQPASTPPLADMWAAWEAVTKAADPYLDSLTTETLQTFYIIKGQPHSESVGSMLRRTTYHYFYHLGEGMAVRQMLGHTNLPEFVGDIHDEAPYVPENG
ncbi:MAG: DUF664 domain-containing protein [Anaerolineaceae bacterium]|nr:DUF664 domain-containing protein [Anaerolineaceae bacterium]